MGNQPGTFDDLMNTEAVSYIVQLRPADLLSIYEKFGKYIRGKKHILTLVDVKNILKVKNVHDSDREMVLDLFSLLDVRWRQQVDMRDLLVCLATIVPGTALERLRLALQLYDTEKKYTVTREDLIYTLNLVNDTCGHFGDKTLRRSDIVDYADAVFTAAGLTGTGDLPYFEHADILAAHPLIEFFVSPQFQRPPDDLLLA